MIAAAHHAGIATPKQLAVIGIDDIPFAKMTVPALTTVRPTHLEQRALLLEQFVTAILTETPVPPRPELDGPTFEVVQRESA
ncbi:substrate-binding domain-containing protein [Nakamurella sp. PAMC28650]|uniref:substrate-binding domain-containing protein n=1 Tax=Nakamurella sp. PAMC28650 TaxID=2762325 RepID=UPI00164CFB46|nr:substrate-binding domain-containing protein [Nakamurella sp. PAMC28650]QNK81598.1 substrate-binding domain-containing protein [Nakamurella sp. PAMC28650]